MRSLLFSWQVHCRAGMLSFGFQSDFLSMIATARQQKIRWIEALPGSTIRVKLLYPNRQRVSKEDIKAALRTLEDIRVAASIKARLAAHAGVPPAALCARTERTAGEASVFANFAEGAFSQAGVVAPPDSPDLGNSIFFQTFGRHPVIFTSNLV